MRALPFRQSGAKGPPFTLSAVEGWARGPRPSTALRTNGGEWARGPRPSTALRTNGGALVLGVLALFLFSGCAQRAARPSPKERRDRGDAQARKPRPEPTLEPRPSDPQRDYLDEGLASYYGPGLHGRRTASGERFNQNAFTAAHRTARFGSCLRVVNMENGASTQVRVNDRGPFVFGRVVDVSRAAAIKLGLIQKGLVRVRLYPCV